MINLDNKDYCENVPNSVELRHECKVTLLWNQELRTDGTIPNNKPVIKIRDDKQRTCMFIGVAIAGDRNVVKKEAGRILKFKDLII